MPVLLPKPVAMPELPEVETVRRGLAPTLAGRRIVRVEARRADLRFPLPERFADRLTGARVLALDRRAKYLLAPLDTGEVWLAHLGMSGRFTVRGAEPAPLYHQTGPAPAHTHIVLETEDGASIEYNDPRRFGFMDLTAAASLSAHRFLAALGPEPLGDGFSAGHLRRVFDGRRQPIKTALLDQRVVAGLGNIYVCEALYRSRIDPRAPAKDLAPPRLRRLVGAIRAVLEEAIAAGGSSLRDFAGAGGDLGYFQHRFQVYDREGQPCGACGRPVARLAQGGRSTFFCERCQR